MLADVLSITAIVLSAASLGWQVVTWGRSGHVVVVKALQSLPVSEDTDFDWVVSVSAANKGRSPVTVNGWGLRLPDGHTLVPTQQFTWSSSLPYRLEPGSDGSWHVATEGVKRVCEENGARYQDLTAFVRLGDGTTVDARERGIGLA